MSSPFSRHSDANELAIPIAVRAYVTSLCGQAEKPPRVVARMKRRTASDYALVFDCETTVDASQRLRFGSYLLRKGDDLVEEGLFYDPDALSEREIITLRNYAQRLGLKLYTQIEFVEEVLFAKAYEWRASIVGFNLPFDISRLAIKCGSARGKTMKGGFTFKMSDKSWWPNIQVKHLSSANALIQFTKPPRRVESRRERKKFEKRPPKRGAFVDVRTLARALCSRSFTLASASAFLKTEHQKAASDDHGGRLTRKYIDYCRNDVQVTWECYQILLEQFRRHGLKETEASKIISEASLGKAYLKEMGILPFREVQPDFPDSLMGPILSTYYGGRSEVRWRRTVKQALYCDFLSMYPTVFTLLGLWRFVIAKGVDWKDRTEETRRLLETTDLASLQKADTWKCLTTIVKLTPDDEIVPVRAKYDGTSYTIGLNPLSTSEPLWYTLADVIASKLLTGKTPEIRQALTFHPREPQDDLKLCCVAGKREYSIDPLREEFFKRIIDLRTAIKRRLKTAKGAERERLASEQLALKILANATSYGIFVEVNVNDLDKRETRLCFGPAGESFEVETDKEEQPGRYFHPLIATLITGGARLMLAITEALINESGLEWAFCDTDSMAIAKPDNMDQTAFFERSKSVCDWFAPLNPYEQKGSLLKIEDQNYSLDGSGELEPLYCLAISAKRYVLFNKTEGEIVIRKASAHSLGHLLSPYSEAEAPKSIAAPHVNLSEIGVSRWQHDLWHKIIEAELAGHGAEVDLSYHPALGNPAASRYGATTPDLLRWFKTANENKPYADCIKPFNFLICFQSVGNFWSEKDYSPIPKRGRRPKNELPKPVAPYDKDIRRASRNAFDRMIGKAIAPVTLKTYRQALAQYHLSPEMKFANGDNFDRGLTVRRHISAASISHIGKEANRWEEQFFTGLDLNAQIEYGVPGDFELLDRRLKEICKVHGERKMAERLGISRGTLRKGHQEGCALLGSPLRSQIAKGVAYKPNRYSPSEAFN